MNYKTSNYAAFYVDEPFNASNLGANATRDFCFYNMLKVWKGLDNSFPFIDSHSKTYNVRDCSDWETTLKPRLRERLRLSKNIILFLSSVTKNSKTLREEIDYGINALELPIIVIYPDFKEKQSILTNGNRLSRSVEQLWEKLPVFRDLKYKVPILHIPLNKELIRSALLDKDFMVNTSYKTGDFFY